MTEDLSDHQHESKLYVTWRHPDGRIHPVGLLTKSVLNGSESYRFVYLKASESLKGFKYLPGLPDRHSVYRSEKLFPVFRNRQMPRRRPDYPRYVNSLGLDTESHPFEVMARNEGRKLTDRIEVFLPPIRTADAELTTLFFARGIRHLEGASEAVTAVQPGDLLTMVDDPDNTKNPLAIRLAIPGATLSAGYRIIYWIQSTNSATAPARRLSPSRPNTSTPLMSLRVCALSAALRLRGQRATRPFRDQSSNLSPHDCRQRGWRSTRGVPARPARDDQGDAGHDRGDSEPMQASRFCPRRSQLATDKWQLTSRWTPPAPGR